MKWIEQTKKLVEELLNLKPEDRLDYLAGIKKCLVGCAYVAGSWDILVGEQDAVSNLAEEDIKKLYEEWRTFTLQLFRHDLVWRINIANSISTNKPEYVS